MEVRMYRSATHSDYQFEIRLALENWRLPLECMQAATALVDGGYSLQRACFMLQNALAQRLRHRLADLIDS